MAEKKKITVTMSSDLFDWCSKKSEEYGMSVPSLFLMAMAQYKEQNTAINELPMLFNKLQEMGVNLGNVKK